MGKRILIFDDNTQLLEVLTPLLEMQGFVVETHSSQDDAIAALQDSPFENVVFSHDSDEKSGGRFLMQLSLCGYDQGLKAVCYSSNTDERALQYLTNLGLKVLTKPLSYERLLEALADHACPGKLGS